MIVEYLVIGLAGETMGGWEGRKVKQIDLLSPFYMVTLYLLDQFSRRWMGQAPYIWGCCEFCRLERVSMRCDTHL